MRLLALTALRPGEVRQGWWSEIESLDSDAPLWRVPAARMKHIQVRALAMADHIVPLSRQAVAALRVLRTLAPADRPDRDAIMFPSWSNARRPISDNSLVFLLQRAGLGGQQVPHGWRATFATVMNEAFPADRGVIDLMLAHTPKNAVEAAYNRATHTARRRELAQAWADMLMEGMAEPEALIVGRRK